MIDNVGLSSALDIGIFHVDGKVVVLFLELAKCQTDWRTEYDKWKFKEHIFK